MPVIEANGLTKRFGDLVAADDLHFSVESGEIFGFLGPNGAGKSTTIRTLLGFLKPTAGTASLLGHDVTDDTALLEAKRRIGYLPDNPSFDATAPVTRVLDLHAGVKGDNRRSELMEAFGPPLDRKVRELSRGNLRKLGIVTTFMHNPDLVILDEPTTGLDPLMQQRFAEFLRAERRDGKTVFFSSHVLSEVRQICDRVGIIRSGRLVTVEPVEALLDRSGKHVRLISDESIQLDRLDIPGVHDLEVGRTVGEEVRECTFAFTGEIPNLLETIGQFELIDISIEEAPLEDVFMRFYGEAEDE